MVRHQEGRSVHGHGLVTARARRVHLTARYSLEERERGLAMWAGAERCVRHGKSFRRQCRLTISCVPQPTQNVEPWRRDTACCSGLHVLPGRLPFTTRPHCGQNGTGELERRWFMFWQGIGTRLGALM